MSLIAAQPTTTLRLSHAAMTAIVTENPNYWPFFVQRLMGHLTVSFTGFADAMIRDQKVRVAAVLLRLANLSMPTEYHPSPSEKVEIAVNQEELAGIANVGRTKVSAILADLRDQGVLDPAYGRIVILDADRLRRIVRG